MLAGEQVTFAERTAQQGAPPHRFPVAVPNEHEKPRVSGSWYVYGMNASW
jgi:hypothetical protein